MFDEMYARNVGALADDWAKVAEALRLSVQSVADTFKSIGQVFEYVLDDSPAARRRNRLRYRRLQQRYSPTRLDRARVAQAAKRRRIQNGGR